MEMKPFEMGPSLLKSRIGRLEKMDLFGPDSGQRLAESPAIREVQLVIDDFAPLRPKLVAPMTHGGQEEDDLLLMVPEPCAEPIVFAHEDRGIGRQCREVWKELISQDQVQAPHPQF
jgi:hypothetical protein